MKKPEIGNMDLGFLTEKTIQTKLIFKGFLTLEPVIEGTQIDLLSYKNNIFKRIQCKTALFEKENDRYKMSLQRARHQLYDLSNIDVFITYIYELDIFYLIPTSDLKKVTVVNLYPHRKPRGELSIYEKYKNNFSILEN
tara:strand:+ start:56 stop:472 length:417 start_codon:yes stop_codon:yes gene_type:complete